MSALHSCSTRCSRIVCSQCSHCQQVFQTAGERRSHFNGCRPSIPIEFEDYPFAVPVDRDSTTGLFLCRCPLEHGAGYSSRNGYQSHIKTFRVRYMMAIHASTAPAPTAPTLVAFLRQKQLLDGPDFGEDETMVRRLDRV